MPQYDAYEDPLPISPSKTPAVALKRCEKHATSSPPVNRRDDGPHADSDNDPFHSQMAFHQRHAHLGRPVPEKTMVPSVTSPESDRAMSPKILTEKEKQELVEMERSQREDDDFRLCTECDALNEGGKQKREDAGGDLNKGATTGKL